MTKLYIVVYTPMKRYFILITLLAIFFFVELIVGIRSSSLTLQTDAFHMLSDLLALCIGAGTLLLINRRKHHRFTYGWSRGEIIGGLVNSVFLLAICFLMTINTIEKFVHLGNTESLNANINSVLIVGGIGLGINIIGILLFHSSGTSGHSHSHSHNHGDTLLNSAVLLHIIGDALGSVAVIISGLCIKYTTGYARFYADPIATLFIITFITIGSIKILRKCITILLHHWAGEAPAEIIERIRGISGVIGVHDFHVWSLDGKYSIATLHVRLEPRTRVKRAMKNIKNILHTVGIHCSTIQPEWGQKCNEPECDSKCAGKQCCATF